MNYVNTITNNAITISDWIKSILPELKDIHIPEDFSISLMADDCSLRKYYLLTTTANSFKNQLNLMSPSEKFVIMQTPIDNSMKNFIEIAKFLSKLDAPITVPKIYAVKSTPPIGYILLSYLGKELLFKHINQQNAESIYKIAWRAIADIQIKAKNFNLPAMDKRYLKKTLTIFKEWYLKTHLNLLNSCNTSINNLLDNLEDFFVKVFYSQPQVFVHVDYHSKNLILPNNFLINLSNNRENLGVLDFQDAMLGPITYDLASLLQDAYLIWPEDLVEKILFNYYDYLLEHNKSFVISKELFLRSFYLTGLQRHLKNLGVFSRMKYFYKKPEYLGYIPNLLHYIHKTCQKFSDPELVIIKSLLINNNPLKQT
jgi:N-acetylmuramate 1-kinase